MNGQEPISIPCRWRPASSGARCVAQKSQSSPFTQEGESELLKTIRATLRGSRGDSGSPITSVLYTAHEDALGEEELSWDAHTVALSTGGVIRKKWSFEEEGQPVQWACMVVLEQQSAVRMASSTRPDHYTYEFQEQLDPIPDANLRPTFGPFARAQRDPKVDKGYAFTSRAVFIVLRSIGKVFFMNGTEHTFYLPFVVRRAWPLSPVGVVLQRVLDPAEVEEAKLSGDVLLPTMFTIVNPFAEAAAVGLSSGITGGFFGTPVTLQDDEAGKPMNSVPAHESVLWVSYQGQDVTDDVLVTLDPDNLRISVWRYAYVRKQTYPTPGQAQGGPPQKPKPYVSGSTSSHRRHPSVPDTQRNSPGHLSLPHVPVDDVPDLPPLAALPGMPPKLTVPTTMANLVSTEAVPEAQRPNVGRGRRNSLGRHDLSINMDRMALGSRPDIVHSVDATDPGKMRATYWVERLHSQEISKADADSWRDISVALFDRRWDGDCDRALMGICLPMTQSLIILSLTKSRTTKRVVAESHARLSASSIVALRASRPGINDLLILKPDRSLALLTQGIREVPLRIARDSAFGVHLPSPEPQITAIKDGLASSVTLYLSDGSRKRLSIDLLPRSMLAGQILYTLAMMLPSDFFFELYLKFLCRWSVSKFSRADFAAFDAICAAIFDVLNLEQITMVSSSLSPNDEGWTKLLRTSSLSRFNEDPALKGLRLPRSPGFLPQIPPASHKPHQYLAPILAGLQQIAQDYLVTTDRYQWLLKLVPVICKLALIVRPEWADYWKRLCPSAMETWPSPSKHIVSHLDDRLPVWPVDMWGLLYGKISSPDWNVGLVETSQLASQFKITPSFAFGHSFGHSDPLLVSRHLLSVYHCFADNKGTTCRARAENAVTTMVKQPIVFVDFLPLGMAAPLREAARTCQFAPSGAWPISAYRLIGRNDLAEGASATSNLHSYGYRSVKEYILRSFPRKSISEHLESVRRAVAGELNTVSGVELESGDFTQIRFGQDRRLEEVARMLCSSTIPVVKTIERPDLSEHDQTKEQQHQVVRMAERTFALPLGRALFTFGSVPVVTGEAYAIPKIEYCIRIQPQNVLIAPEPGKIPLECIAWGEFHNGVAAGLRISPSSHTVESSWIKFNKPSELTPEHAGFLYALGLTGHLREMLTWHTFGYLTPKHELTSIGVLLGLSAANAGSGNRHVTKLLAVHTPALLPTPNVDLNVPLVTQAAGLMGIGLLYMGTKNRRMAEVCLSQISRRDLVQPDLSNEYREAYTYSAALAFGMVMLGRGSGIPVDMALLSRLRMLIHGPGHSLADGASHRPQFDINLTSPAATIALGLMYLKTERQDVADILTIPDTVLALDRIQPNFLLLRTVARALIMWNGIAPNNGWVNGQIPPPIAQAMADKTQGNSVIESFELAYYNIIAGCCFAIALKYAGTAREEAYLLIIRHYDMFSQLAYTNGPAFDHRIKRAAIRDGLNLISIALNMVMAGTGEINCLRRLRYAYGMYNQPIRYGTHVATHTSLGLLFLGGGRYTLGTSDAAVACMVAAFFPRFAQVSSDNKSYLQALRHLWVLAVEPRCLIARDIDTKQVVYLPVKIKVKDDKDVGTTQLISPTLIPDLDKLVSIRVDTPRYWPFYLDFANFPRHKESLLRSQTLFVKRRTAFLSYMEDPKGSRSLFVRSHSSTGDAATLDFPQLTDIETHPATDLHHFISSYSNDTLFLSFADRFCRGDGETDEERLFQEYCHASLLDSILQDKSRMVQTLLTLYRYRRMSPDSRYFNLVLQDLRFAADFYNKVYDWRFSGRTENMARPPLIRETTLSGALHTLDKQLDKVRVDKTFLGVLRRYVRGLGVPAYPPSSPEGTASRALSWYLQRNNVPSAILLVLMKALATSSREQCLKAAPPQGTTDARVLFEAIKEVLHATGSQTTTVMGSGWSIRSLEEIVALWEDEPNAQASTMSGPSQQIVPASQATQK